MGGGAVVLGIILLLTIVTLTEGAVVGSNEVIGLGIFRLLGILITTLGSCAWRAPLLGDSSVAPAAQSPFFSFIATDPIITQQWRYWKSSFK
jgi:hypothetical protein